MSQSKTKTRYLNTKNGKYTRRREFISMTKVVLTYEDGSQEEMLRSDYEKVVREVSDEKN